MNYKFGQVPIVLIAYFSGEVHLLGELISKNRVLCEGSEVCLVPHRHTRQWQGTPGNGKSTNGNGRTKWVHLYQTRALLHTNGRHAVPPFCVFRIMGFEASSRPSCGRLRRREAGFYQKARRRSAEHKPQTHLLQKEAHPLRHQSNLFCLPRQKGFFCCFIRLNMI